MKFGSDLSFGAQLQPDGSTSFRIWASGAETMSLAIEGAALQPMRVEPDGWHALTTNAPPGTRYRYRLPDGTEVPDPASRAQGNDIHDPSVVVDPRAYDWRHGDWTGRPWEEAVIYECHTGLMGGYAGLRDKLKDLAGIGFTAVQLMPLADIPGRNNWGYDGVLPYAPDASYGTPDELKAAIDEAHGLGLMVFLDVVYNHFGPDGNYLHAYASQMFRDDITTPWGPALDFRLREVRDYFTQNAIYWTTEYRFDGLRLDAVHAIASDDWLDEMAAAVRAAAGAGRHVHLVVENEHNDARLLARGGIDAQWNDDMHHCVHVLLTGETESYYGDYAPHTVDKLARSLMEGFVYQGDYSERLDKRRGSPSGELAPTAFINFLQNHDQIGNRAFGERLLALADPRGVKAAAAMLLLAPQIPMVFMGEEIGSKTPFLFFTDHHDELADAVREGRREEFKGFAAFQDEARRATIPDPNDAATYRASRPTADPEEAALWRAFYTELLMLRRTSIVPGLKGTKALHATVLGEKALTAAWRLGDGRTLTISANLGPDDVAIAAASGTHLYAATPLDVVPAGTLPGYSTIVHLGLAR